jgi:carbon storage regulator
MLVLTRKLNEEIVINGNIVVTVLGVKGDRVKLGVTAPEDVPVNRSEIENAKTEERRPRLLRPFRQGVSA